MCQGKKVSSIKRTEYLLLAMIYNVFIFNVKYINMKVY